MPDLKLAATNPKPPAKRKLPSWIAGYASFTANTEAPPEYHMWTAVSTMAAAMNRKCWIDMGTFSIYPSMYIVFVAPPGIATKSTTAGIGNSMLEATEAVPLAAASGSWQGMIDELVESHQVVQLEEGKPQVTISPLHVFASELGTFLKLDDGDQVDTLVDLWDGKPRYKRRLRSGEINVPRPYLNLLACTTPAWLTQHAKDYLLGGGFFSRTIFVYAEQKGKLIAYPESNINYTLKAELEFDLQRIAEITGEFTLTPEAKEWGTAWYEETWAQTPEHLIGDRFQGYLSRRQNHLHKVAMVVSASESSDRIITKEHLETAANMLYLSEESLRTIYESLATNDKVGAYRKVRRAVKTYQKVSKHVLFKELSSNMSYMEFEEALKGLLFAQEVRAAQQGQQLYIKWNKV